MIRLVKKQYDLLREKWVTLPGRGGGVVMRDRHPEYEDNGRRQFDEWLRNHGWMPISIENVVGCYYSHPDRPRRLYQIESAVFEQVRMDLGEEDPVYE